jgi:hypothetical protein
MSKTWGIASFFTTAVGVGAVLTLLSGCMPGAQEEPPNASETATASVATPEASATPSPVESASPDINLEDPSSWLIDFGGIGPVRYGGQIADVRQSMGAFVEDTLPDYCPAARFREGSLVLVALLADDFSTITSISTGRWDYSSSVSSPRTAEGIGVGSTFEELLTAYPAITKSGEYGGGDNPTLYYAMPNGSGMWLVFIVTSDLVEFIDVRTTSKGPSEYCS